MSIGGSSVPLESLIAPVAACARMIDTERPLLRQAIGEAGPRQQPLEPLRERIERRDAARPHGLGEADVEDDMELATVGEGLSASPSSPRGM